MSIKFKDTMIAEISALDFKTELAKNVDTLLHVGPAELEAVMKHYGVTTEALKEMIRNIRDWYEKQAHLPQGQLHNRFILGHLMNRGFSVQRTKWNIDNFYTARSRMPELLCDRDLDSSWLWYLQRFYYVLPKRTPENYRITIFRMIKVSNDVVGIQAIKGAFLRCEYRIWNDIAFGDCCIVDLNHITMQQALQLTPVLISKIIYFWKSCYGAKLVSAHVINMPSFCANIFNLFKKALNAKIVSRIHLIKAEQLTKIFPKDALPIEYGGTEFSCEEIADRWVKTYQSEPWRKYLAEQDSVLCDESKRLMPSKANGIFGVEGSFKKLCID